MIYILNGVLCLIFFLLGLGFHKLLTKPDGRLVINEDTEEYFVGITTKTEELKKKEAITLTVILTSSNRGGV